MTEPTKPTNWRDRKMTPASWVILIVFLGVVVVPVGIALYRWALGL